MSSLSEERRAAMRRFSAQLDLHGPIAWFRAVRDLSEGAGYYPIDLGHMGPSGDSEPQDAAALQHAGPWPGSVRFARSWFRGKSNCRMQIR